MRASPHRAPSLASPSRPPYSASGLHQRTEREPTATPTSITTRANISVPPLTTICPPKPPDTAGPRPTKPQEPPPKIIDPAAPLIDYKFPKPPRSDQAAPDASKPGPPINNAMDGPLPNNVMGEPPPDNAMGTTAAPRIDDKFTKPPRSD